MSEPQRHEEPLNPLELDDANVPGDGGLLTGEPGAGTERNQAASPPTLNLTETGDVSGATSTHHGAGGNFEHNGGTGTAPTEVH